MNCDNKLRFVKGDDHANPDALCIAGVSRAPFLVEIDSYGSCNHAFSIADRRPEPPRFVLRVPAEMHAHPRAELEDLSPAGPHFA